MPALKLFRRSWQVAGDDLVYPFALLTFLDLICFVLTAASLGVCGLANGSGCVMTSAKFSSPAYFLLGQTVLIGCSLLLHCGICAVSALGGIMQTEKRKPLVPLLYIRVVLFIVQAFWLIIAGAVLLGGEASLCSCASLLLGEAIGTTVYEAVLLFAALLSLLFIYDVPGKRVAIESDVDGLQRNQAVKRYQSAFRFAFCGVRGSRERRNEAFAELATTLVQCLGHVDLVASDFLAGLLLVRDLASLERHKQRTLPSTFVLNGIVIGEHRTQFVDITSSQTFEKLAYFSQYAYVPYGLPLFMISNGCSSLCASAKHMCCSCCSSDSRRFYSAVDTRYMHSVSVQEDAVRARRRGESAEEENMLLDLETGCCVCESWTTRYNCDLEGVRLTLAQISEPSSWHDASKAGSAARPSLLYFSACDRLDETPMVIVYDPLFDKLVVSIRGTMSIANVLADANGDAAPIFGDSQPDLLAHRGILRVANLLYNRLVNGILQRTLKQAEQLRSKNKDHNAAESMKGNLCDIVVVGHSLGAGLATLVCTLLRADSSITNAGERQVEALSYSPPGGLVSAALSERMRSFVTSIVVGDDCVPRAGITQLERFRDDVQAVLKACCTPKWRLIGREMLQSCCCAQKRWPIFDSVDTVNLTAHSSEPADMKLLLAGNIVHIMRISKRKQQMLAKRPPSGDPDASKTPYRNAGTGARPTRSMYVARIASPLEFDRLLLTGRTVVDHMPYFVSHALVSTITGHDQVKRLLCDFQFV